MIGSPVIGSCTMNRLLASLNEIASQRIAIGLAQGIALYGLLEANRDKAWPADRPETLWPLLAVAIFVPLLAIVGIGNLRRRPLAIWIAVAAILCAWLAYHAAAQGYSDLHWPFWIWTGVGIPWMLFVINALVTAGGAQRPAVAALSTSFHAAPEPVPQPALSPGL